MHCDQVEGLGDFAELEVVLNDDQVSLSSHVRKKMYLIFLFFNSYQIKI